MIGAVILVVWVLLLIALDRGVGMKCQRCDGTGQIIAEYRGPDHALLSKVEVPCPDCLFGRVR